MATVSVVSQRVGGGGRETVADVTMDSSYPTGGEVFTADQVKMHRVDYGTASVRAGTSASANCASAFVSPTASGFNLKTFLANPAEMSNGGDLATVTIRCILYGA